MLRWAGGHESLAGLRLDEFIIDEETWIQVSDL